MQKRSTAVWPVLLLALVGVVGLYWLALLLAHLNHAEHGTTPDWIAAVATLAAFGAAAVAAWYAHRALTVEQGRDRARDDQLDRAQAETVAAWIAGGPYYATVAAGDAVGSLQANLVDIVIRNASQLPVMDVEVSVYLWQIGRGDPEFVASRSFRLLPPGTDTPVRFENAEIAPIDPEPDPASGGVVALAFTDAGGRAWVRRVNATLMRRPSEDEPVLDR